MLNANPGALQAFFADSIRLMPEFQKTVTRKENALLYYQALLSRFRILAFAMDAAEVLDLGGCLAETGKFSATLQLKSTGKAREVKGKYMHLWKISTGHAPRLLTAAWNYDHPLEMEAQLRFEAVPVTDVALQPHLPISSNIRFELAALNRLMEATVTQHDAPTWERFYADDGMFLYSRHAAVQGRQAINTFLEAHARELPVFEHLDIRNDRVDHLGDYVIEYASHIASWRTGDYSGVGLGKDLRIWRREQDGSLKIFRHIAMYD
ncbi:hypothetical protein GCM10009415_34940 [Chitinophaga japonensis]